MIWYDIWGKWFGLDQCFDNLVNGLSSQYGHLQLLKHYVAKLV